MVLSVKTTVYSLIILVFCLDDVWFTFFWSQKVPIPRGRLSVYFLCSTTTLGGNQIHITGCGIKNITSQDHLLTCRKLPALKKCCIECNSSWSVTELATLMVIWANWIWSCKLDDDYLCDDSLLSVFQRTVIDKYSTYFVVVQ